MLEITPQTEFKLKECFVLHHIEELDKYWLLNIAAGDIYRLNDVSMYLLKNMREGITFESLLAKLLQEFDVEENTARQDLRDILENLLAEGIITTEKG